MFTVCYRRQYSFSILVLLARFVLSFSARSFCYLSHLSCYLCAFSVDLLHPMYHCVLFPIHSMYDIIVIYLHQIATWCVHHSFRFLMPLCFQTIFPTAFNVFINGQGMMKFGVIMAAREMLIFSFQNMCVCVCVAHR